jgi:hypothetical protein
MLMLDVEVDSRNLQLKSGERSSILGVHSQFILILWPAPIPSRSLNFLHAREMIKPLI